MKNLRYVFVLAALACCVVSCTKEGVVGPPGQEGQQGERGEKGDTGPRGANGAKGDKGDRGATGTPGATGPKGDKGDRGAQGPAGPRGATGAQGPAGSVNVTYSDWAWAGTGSGSAVTINAPKLTQAILDRGVVAVYARVYKGGASGGLLGTYRVPFQSPHGEYLEFSAAVGAIQVYGNTSMLLTDYQFRYILIPGGVAAVAGLDLRDYDSIRSALQIAD